jgi:hypothetical protein
LRIPSGWLVRHNELRTVDPETLPAGHADWVLMTQDLMQLDQSALDLLIDLGWYPDERPEGQFKLTVILGGDWERPLSSFTTRTVATLVDHLEALLASPIEIPYERLVERLMHLNPEARADAAEELAHRGLVGAVDSIRDALGREKDEDIIGRLLAAMRSLIHQRKQQPSS